MERSPDDMIVETIFSTVDENGRPNFAPMGLVWGEDLATVLPFRETQTCHNLLSTRYGVANLSDDVLAYVQSALYDSNLPHFPAKAGPGIVFSNTCSWREMEVVSQTGTSERAEFGCRIVYEGRQRDFLGFRRAGNAVIEAVILATRQRYYARNTLEEWLMHYRGIVEKTGDATDKEAFQMVYDFIRKRAQ